MKIAIVGCYPETWPKAPFDDETWTIWGFSRKNYNKLPRCDQWFELHNPSMYPRYELSFPGYTKWLKEVGAVTQPDFPHEGILARHGSHFLTHGQIPWLMAYAIDHEPDEIGLWGIESIGAYKPQRAEIQHFIWIAESEGINVLAPGSTLLEPNKLYAFS